VGIGGGQSKSKQVKASQSDDFFEGGLAPVVTPFQGWMVFWVGVSRGVAPGCHVWAFQARETPEIQGIQTKSSRLIFQPADMAVRAPYLGIKWQKQGLPTGPMVVVSASLFWGRNAMARGEMILHGPLDRNDLCQSESE
jgi:hypothetical protein